jgi:hypothetical protein
MLDGVFTLGASNVLEMRGAVDIRPDPWVPFETVLQGTIATGRLFNAENDTKTKDIEVLSDANTASGTDVISLASSIGLSVGDFVELGLDDGLTHPSTLSAVGPTSVTLADVTPSVSSSGKTLRRVKMGATSKHFEVVALGSIRIGNSLSVALDDGSRKSFVVDQVIAYGSRSIIRTTAGPVLSTISSGRRVGNQIGPDIVMADFGTPVLNPGDKAFGFRADIGTDHGEFEAGMRLRGEVVALELGGLVAIKNVFATVQEAA